MLQALLMTSMNTLYKGRLFYSKWFRWTISSKDYLNTWWQPQLALAGASVSRDEWSWYPPQSPIGDAGMNDDSMTVNDDLAIWFAVPKQKVSRMKKRMKTTLRKRIPLRHDIITDPRTGELTLRHKLPFNWKNYLPNALNPTNATPDGSSP